VTDPAEIVRAATIGRRAPIGRIRYAAERISAILERGANPTVNLLAVRTILEGVADELDAAPLRTPATPVRPTAWPEDGSVPWGGTGQDCPYCVQPDPPRSFLCQGHPAGTVAGPATGSEGPMLAPGSYPKAVGDATMAADMCPGCKGDNSEAWALCAACEVQS
jgi:hypothetical protein